MPEENLWNKRFIFLLIAQAGFGFAHSAFLMLPKFLATELDAGPDEIGWVVAASAVSIVFFLLPAGAMVDRFGRRRFLTAGAIGMAIASACYVEVESIGPLLYFLRLAQALAFAFAFAAGGALCVDAAPPARLGQAIGLFGLSYVVMGAFAPAAIEELVAFRDWDAAFLVAASAALGCALLSLGIREVAVPDQATEPVPLFRIVVRPEIMRAILIVGLLGVAFGCAMNFHQPYALSLGLTELRSFFIANSLAAAASRLTIGPFIDRIGLVRVSVASLILYACVVFCMSWLDEIGLALLGLGMGLSHGLFYPAYTAMVLADCPSDERGRRMSIIQAGLNLGIGTGGVALGWIAAEHGYPAIFTLSAGLLVVGCVLILYFERLTARSKAAPFAGASPLTDST